MSKYSAAVSGTRTINVFDVKSGVSSYNIQLESDTVDIGSLTVNGDILSFTRTDKQGAIHNILHDLNKAQRKQSRIVGHVPKSPVVNKPVQVSAPTVYNKPVEKSVPAVQQQTVADDVYERVSYTAPEYKMTLQDHYNEIENEKKVRDWYIDYRGKSVSSITLAFYAYIGCVIFYYHGLVFDPNTLHGWMRIAAWCTVIAVSFGLPIQLHRQVVYHILKHLCTKTYPFTEVWDVHQSLTKYICWVYYSVFYLMNYTWINRFVVGTYHVVVAIVDGIGKLVG